MILMMEMLQHFH